MADISVLRSITVGAKKKFKSEIIEWEGQEFEIRQPSVAQRSQILQNARIQVDEDSGGVAANIGALQIWSVICCTFAPGSKDPLFNENDYEAISNMPAGGFVDKFAAVAMKYINADADDIAKNSEEILNDNSSSE